MDISPEPKSLPLALLAEPHPEGRWVQVELPVGNHGAELIVGAFMIPDSGRPSCWCPAGSIGVERLDPEDEWAIVTNPEIADLAWSQLTFEAYTQLGDSGVR